MTLTYRKVTLNLLTLKVISTASNILRGGIFLENVAHNTLSRIDMPTNRESYGYDRPLIKIVITILKNSSRYQAVAYGNDKFIRSQRRCNRCLLQQTTNMKRHSDTLSKRDVADDLEECSTSFEPFFLSKQQA